MAAGEPQVPVVDVSSESLVVDRLCLTDWTWIVAVRVMCGGGRSSWRCAPGRKAPDSKECS